VVADSAAAVSLRHVIRTNKRFARFEGWSEHFSYERWMRCAETTLADELCRCWLVHHR